MHLSVSIINTKVLKETFNGGIKGTDHGVKATYLKPRGFQQLKDINLLTAGETSAARFSFPGANEPPANEPEGRQRAADPLPMVIGGRRLEGCAGKGAGG